MTTSVARRCRQLLASLVCALTICACGLPDDGVTQVDDATVPYQLLDPEGPARSEPSMIRQPARSQPLLYWLDESELLVPTAVGTSCSEPTETQVASLLEGLASGPSEQDRAAGRVSAWGQPAHLDLVEMSGTTAVVELDPQLPTSADRLPLAVGQVVLSAASARGLEAVLFVTDGEPVQVPLPGGALTAAAVTAADYAELVGGASTSSPERWQGCD